jgi:hypothetical protein
MKAFGMVVRHEFLHHVAQVPFTEEDKMVQALVPDRFDKTFRVRIAIRALRRDFHALDSAGAKQRLERIGE